VWPEVIVVLLSRVMDASFSYAKNLRFFFKLNRITLTLQNEQICIFLCFNLAYHTKNLWASKKFSPTESWLKGLIIIQMPHHPVLLLLLGFLCARNIGVGKLTSLHSIYIGCKSIVESIFLVRLEGMSF
jgi:hypothetical protein